MNEKFVFKEITLLPLTHLTSPVMRNREHNRSRNGGGNSVRGGARGQKERGRWNLAKFPNFYKQITINFRRLYERNHFHRIKRRPTPSLLWRRHRSDDERGGRRDRGGG